MTGSESSSVLDGCELAALGSARCGLYLSWLLGKDGSAPPEEAHGLRWALAHCDDGVTWGRFDAEQQVWRLGSDVAPKISPQVRAESLQEVRFFSEAREVLIWRAGRDLYGRVLQDGDRMSRPGATSSSLRPSDESRILRGVSAITQYEHDFTHVGDHTGSEQVLPLAVTTDQLRTGRVRLAARHYFESDSETGVARVAATRLVKLVTEVVYGA